MSSVQTELVGDVIAMDELQHCGPIAGSSPPPPPPGGRGRLRITIIMIALNLSQLVAALNTTLLATAVPTISSEFDSSAGYTWIGGAYLLASATAGPMWAKWSDIWGRKPMLLAAIAAFFASSLVCGLAVDMQMLIAGRVVQGVAGGGILGLVQIIVSDIFSLRLRSLFIGILAFMWATAGAAGPILGGTFTQLLSWRWCFYISLPTSGLAFLLVLLSLDVHDPGTKMLDGLKAVDWLGSFSIIGMVLMILLGLDFGGAIFPWNSPKVICLIVFGALCSVFFYFSEKRWAKYPVIPLDIFRNRSNAASFLVVFLQGLTYIGAEYYLPLYFQAVRGASPLESGILMVPSMVAALSAIATGVVVHRVGRYRMLIWLGSLFMTLGNGLYINLGVNSSTAAIVLFQLVAGLGIGSLFDAPLIALQANIPQKDVAVASATMSSVRNIATAISIIVGGVVFQNSMNLRKGQLEQAGLSSDLIEQVAGAMTTAHTNQVALIQDPGQQLAVKEALSWSLRNMWIMYTCIAFFAFLSSLLIEKHDLAHEHTETQTGLKNASEKQPPVMVVEGA